MDLRVLQYFLAIVREESIVRAAEEGMIFRKRTEAILDLVKKTESEVTLTNDIIMGDIYIIGGVL